MAQLSRVPKPWTTSNTLVPPPLLCVSIFQLEREIYFDRFFGYIEYITMALGLLSYIGSGGRPAVVVIIEALLHSMLCVCVCAREFYSY